MIPVPLSDDPTPMVPRPGPVPVKRPAAGSGFFPRTGIWKFCFECEGYFQGQLDGDYRCPTCRQADRHRERALAPLDSALTVMPATFSIVPRMSPERVHAEIGKPHRAVGGA